MKLGLQLTAGLRMELRQKLSPQIIQSIEILQQSSLELEQTVRRELEENPCIEEGAETPPAAAAEHRPNAPGNGHPGPDGAAATAPEPLAGPDREPRADTPVDHERIEDFGGGWMEYFDFDRPGRRGTMEDSDRKLEALENTAARGESLQDAVYRQFCLVEPDPERRRIAHHVIYNLTDAGYLPYPLDEVLDDMPVPAPLAAGEAVLRVIQQLEPAGVGARTLNECLLLQLDPDDPDAELQRRLIESHLDDLTRNKLPKVARELGVDLDRLKALLAGLSHLSPHPGHQYSREASHYITPDLLCTAGDEGYQIEAVRQSLPEFHVSEQYLLVMNPPADPTPEQRAFLDSLSTEEKAFIRKKIEDALWLRQAIEQRRTTLERVARRILDHQRDFLDHGVAALKPMKMQDVAEELGIHVSTVSRALANKYVQTPRGIFPLRYFFTGGIASEGGDAESTEAVRARIRGLVDAENKDAPLSDEELALQLKDRHGLSVARRTITKYRKAMRIPSSRQRREY